MKLTKLILLLAIVTIQQLLAGTSPFPAISPAVTFAGMPPIDIANMSDYDWTVVRDILKRAAKYSHIKLSRNPQFSNGGVSLVIEGPPYEDDYLVKFASEFQRMTNALISSMSPCVLSTELIHIEMEPSNVGLIQSPATAALGASDLKPQYHSGQTILFSEVWNACINKVGMLPGMEVDSQSESNTAFPYKIKTKWGVAKYAVPGFVVRERISLELQNWMQGKSMRLAVDSELEMRRESSPNWIYFGIDEKTVGYANPTTKNTTQDICLFELAAELKK